MLLVDSFFVFSCCRNGCTGTGSDGKSIVKAGKVAFGVKLPGKIGRFFPFLSCNFVC
jgi:hypothetical protein